MPWPPSPRRPVRRYEPSRSGSFARRGAVSGMRVPPRGHCLSSVPFANEAPYEVRLISHVMDEPLSVIVTYDDVGQVPPLWLKRVWLNTTLVWVELDGC